MRSAQLGIVLSFSAVVILADVDQILKNLGTVIDGIAPPEEAAKYKASAEKVRACIESRLAKLNETTLSEVFGSTIPVAVDCKKEIEGVDDEAERKSKFSDCARSKAMNLFMEASDSQRGAFMESKKCIVSYMEKVLYQ